MLNELIITTENTPYLYVFIQIWQRALERQKLMVFRLAHNAFTMSHSWSRQPQTVLLNKVMGRHDASSFPGSLSSTMSLLQVFSL